MGGLLVVCVACVESERSIGAGALDPCELEITVAPVEDDSPLNCRGETLKPEDKELTWLALWAEQAEQRVFVYWDYDELWSGATVELPLANSDKGIVTIEYFANDSMWRADHGTIQLLESGAGPGHYIVELNAVRFDALPDLEINGVIGAKLEHFACLGCE